MSLYKGLQIGSRHGDVVGMKPFLEQMADLDVRRQAAKITDQELAEVAGVDRFMLSKYRNGHRRPSMDNWIALNNALETVIVQRHAALEGLLTK